MCYLWQPDKQLVELIHVKALDVLRGHQQDSMRYQSVTLFLRGTFINLRVGGPWLANCQIYCISKWIFLIIVKTTNTKKYKKLKEHKVKRMKIQIPTVHISDFLLTKNTKLSLNQYNLTYRVYFFLKVQTWNYFCKQHFVLLNITTQRTPLHHEIIPTYVYLKINTTNWSILLPLIILVYKYVW